MNFKKAAQPRSEEIITPIQRINNGKQPYRSSPGLRRITSSPIESTANSQSNLLTGITSYKRHTQPNNSSLLDKLPTTNHSTTKKRYLIYRPYTNRLLNKRIYKLKSVQLS